MGGAGSAGGLNLLLNVRAPQQPSVETMRRPWRRSRRRRVDEMGRPHARLMCARTHAHTHTRTRAHARDPSYAVRIASPGLGNPWAFGANARRRLLATATAGAST